MSIIFKIRDRSTGLFSTGGTNPTWSHKGKTWLTKGNLMNHLTQHVDWHSEENTIPKEWEVVEIEALVEIKKTHDAATYFERSSAKWGSMK